MTRSILGVLAFTAVLVPWQSVNIDHRFSGRTGPYLGEKPPGLTPEVFAPGLISTGGFERDVAITPDGREIYFGLAGPSYQYTAVVVTREVDGRWTEPAVVTSLRSRAVFGAPSSRSHSIPPSLAKGDGTSPRVAHANGASIGKESR